MSDLRISGPRLKERVWESSWIFTADSTEGPARKTKKMFFASGLTLWVDIYIIPFYLLCLRMVVDYYNINKNLETRAKSLHTDYNKNAHVRDRPCVYWYEQNKHCKHKFLNHKTNTSQWFCLSYEKIKEIYYLHVKCTYLPIIIIILFLKRKKYI